MQLPSFSLTTKFIILILLVISLCSIYKKAYGKRIYWFTSPDCKHCDKMKPEWKEFKNKMRWSPTVSAISINVNSTDPYHKSLVESFGIKRVPSIWKVKDDIRTEFKDKKTSDKLYKFSQ